LTQAHDDTAIIAVGNMAHSECQKEHRQKLGESNKTKIKCIPSEGIDLPANSDPLYLEGNSGRHTRKTEQRERLMPQD
jgi:hypothetical protein